MMVWAFSVGNKVRFDNLAFWGLGVSIFFFLVNFLRGSHNQNDFPKTIDSTQTIIPIENQEREKKTTAFKE